MGVKFLTSLLLLYFIAPVPWITAQNTERKLRIAVHVFQDDEGGGNLHRDSLEHEQFLLDILDWVNHKALNLDTLKPAYSSSFVPSIDVKLLLDTILYHRDTYAWNCDPEIDGEYMRQVYIDQDSSMSYREMHGTLAIFIGGNYPMVGGHVSQIGDKRYIAMRGFYAEYFNKDYHSAVYECGRNLFHEVGHALGLNHNFQGGEAGDQCDECEDNGCPEQGSSNNLMDYWPAYGHALSDCQLQIINQHLSGNLGSIAEVLINDSCMDHPAGDTYVISHDTLYVSDELYLPSSLVIKNNGLVRVTGLMSISRGDSITVYPGGRLEIDGGMVCNNCGELWAGIRLATDQAQDTASLPDVRITNGGRVKTALTGLFIDRSMKLQLNQAIFEDCVNSLVINNANDTLRLNECKFIAGRGYPMREWGYGLQAFVKLENSMMSIGQSAFINTDEFRLNFDQRPESGTGIIAENSWFQCSTSHFENLYRGVLHAGQSNHTCLIADSLSFTWCEAGIHLFQSPISFVTHSTFHLEKFNDHDSYGVYAEEPGSILVEDNQFHSVYGPANQTALFIDQPRGGTQVVYNNLFNGLSNGLIHRASSEEPVWPEDLVHELGSPLLSRDFGLVVRANRYNNSTIKYGLLLPDGSGLAKVDQYASLIRKEYTQEFNWAIGGLSFFHPENEIAMIGTTYQSEKTPALDHNFHWNSLGNDQSTKQLQGNLEEFDQTLIELQEAWDSPTIGFGDSGHLVQSWIELDQLLSSHNHVARRNLDLYRIMGPLADWPEAIIYRLSKSTTRSSEVELLVMHRISYLAMKQLEQLRNHPQSNIPDYVPGDRFIPNLRTGGIITQQPYSIRLDSEFSDPQGFEIYPNPSDGIVYIKMPDLGSLNDHDLPWCMVFDQQGKMIWHRRLRQLSDLEFNLSTFPAGSYTIIIRNQQTFFGHRKFIILRH